MLLVPVTWAHPGGVHLHQLDLIAVVAACIVVAAGFAVAARRLA